MTPPKLRRAVSLKFLLGFFVASLGCLTVYVLSAKRVAPATSVRVEDPVLKAFRVAVLPQGFDGTALELRSLYNKREAQVARPTAIWLPASQAELTIVVPGLGGESRDVLNKWFALESVRGGRSVLIMPSPSSGGFVWHRMRRFHWRESFSALCDALEEFSSTVEWQRYERILVSGYSLGARHAIGAVPCLRRLAPAAKLSVVAMNPPLNMSYAASTLDRYLHDSMRPMFDVYWAGGYLRFMQVVLSFFSWAKPVTTVEASVAELRDRLDSALWPLAGDSGRLQNIMGRAFAVKLESGLRGRDVPWNSLSLEDPTLRFRTLLGTDEALPATEIDVRRALRETEDRVYMLHSLDDDLSRPADIEVVRAMLGSHAQVFPYGGHVGMMFEPEFGPFISGALAR